MAPGGVRVASSGGATQTPMPSRKHLALWGRMLKKGCRGPAQHRPPDPGPHHPDAPLQPVLRLLQRVRQRVPAGAAPGDAAAGRPPGESGHGGHHDQRGRAADESRARAHHRPHPRARHDLHAHLQRLLLLAGAHRQPQRGGARSPRDQHRQRRARRGLLQEPASARAEAEMAVGAGPSSRSASTRSWAVASIPRRMP